MAILAEISLIGFMGLICTAWCVDTIRYKVSTRKKEK